MEKPRGEGGERKEALQAMLVGARPNRLWEASGCSPEVDCGRFSRTTAATKLDRKRAVIWAWNGQSDLLELCWEVCLATSVAKGLFACLARCCEQCVTS